MITLTAKINLLSGDISASAIKQTNLSGNNISCDLGGVVGVKRDGSNPFIFGVSKFGDGSVFSGAVDYFISNQLSDENGNFYPVPFITFNPLGVKSLSFDFDKINRRHPNSIELLGGNATIVEKDDDPLFTITNIDPTTEYTVQFPNWNTPNAPLVITGIYTRIELNIDRRNMISIECNTADRADFKLPSFGIISNTARIEFIDSDGQIADYADKLLLVEGLPCEITLENTLVDGAVETLGKYETAEWQYDNDSRTVSVSLKDDLEEWQEINVEGINYDPRKPQAQPLSWFYQYLWERTDKRIKGNYTMLSLDELDQDTRTLLNSVYVPYPLLESGTLWQQWDKLCVVAQAHIYSKNGTVIFKYNGGN